MITPTKKYALPFDNDKWYIEGVCLSTDTKPTGYSNGSLLLEIDTGHVYFFDEASRTWKEFA